MALLTSGVSIHENNILYVLRLHTRCLEVGKVDIVRLSRGMCDMRGPSVLKTEGKERLREDETNKNVTKGRQSVVSG